MSAYKNICTGSSVTVCGPGGSDQVVVVERDMVVTFVSSPVCHGQTCDLWFTGHLSAALL